MRTHTARITLLAMTLVGSARAADAPDDPEVDAVLSAVAAHQPEVSACEAGVRAVDPTLEGEVRLTWRIRGGRVHRLRVERDTTGSRALVRCVTDVVRRMRFEAGADGNALSTWVFSPKARGASVAPPGDHRCPRWG